jgi:hypothetical protein
LCLCIDFLPLVIAVREELATWRQKLVRIIADEPVDKSGGQKAGYVLQISARKHQIASFIVNHGILKHPL